MQNRLTKKGSDGHYEFHHFVKFLPKQVIADHIGRLEAKLEKKGKNKDE